MATASAPLLQMQATMVLIKHLLTARFRPTRRTSVAPHWLR